ncbi:hypothetical protein K2X14_10295 [Acetobacter sp. TBRC 12305]|uniref:Uncharacterized protein n=1 Tax=Acetobacter garciniae TaxID=2817435 RepID=A0A939KN64_9PROT|nr:hypothetical protein [Acetobacter garciniae]MBO1326033.1 hypothetical protein [Acetobacter garciniae]MBX0345223.1 hypothetical protein [Acetobacter garciniae]
MQNGTGARRLGCLPARVLLRQPRLAGLRMMQALAPPSLPRTGIDPAPLMLGNDTLGDCTSAGLGNAIRAVAALGGYQVAVTQADAIRFYAASTGYSPANPASDLGGVEVDVLAYAARHGFALGTQSLFPLWGSADPADFNALRLVMAGLGVAYLGVRLSVSDLNRVEASNGACVLDVGGIGWGDTTPGSAGGHCLLAWAYDGTAPRDCVTLLSWGSTATRCTWRWLASRIMEAHGLLWPQLALANGYYPTGPDIATLRADNAALLAG